MLFRVGIPLAIAGLALAAHNVRIIEISETLQNFLETNLYIGWHRKSSGRCGFESL